MPKLSSIYVTGLLPTLMPLGSYQHICHQALTNIYATRLLPTYTPLGSYQHICHWALTNIYAIWLLSTYYTPSGSNKNLQHVPKLLAYTYLHPYLPRQVILTVFYKSETHICTHEYILIDIELKPDQNTELLVAKSK